MAEQKAHVRDCLEFMNNDLGDGSVDIVVTSPPYNLNIKYGHYKDNKSREEYLIWLDEIFVVIKRVLKDDGSFFLNIGGTNVDPWIPMDVAQVARKHFALQNNMTWIKSISIDEDSYGHFKPINSKRFLNHTHENMFHFTKEGNVPLDRLAIGVPYVHPSNLTRWNHGRTHRCRGDSWYVPYKTVQARGEKGEHPAVFPERLVEMCVKMHGYDENTLVFDPFLGIGTVLVVCKRLGVSASGTDIDSEYVRYAEEWLKES